jgi:DNA-directed RNA polymerase specialized sigma subunit
MNPVDEALEALDLEVEQEKDAFAKRRSGALNPRAQRELEMWQQWNGGGRKPTHLRPLVKSLQPLVKNRMKVFEHRVRDIQPAAIQAEFNDQLLGALETFNPDKGKMTTWINHRLMKANRFITTYQNPARIGEKRIGKITKFHQAEDMLQDKLGRSPSSHEIADHMKRPVNEVQMLRSEIRDARPIGMMQADPTHVVPSRAKEIMRLLPYDLTPDENAVFERVHGIGVKRQGTGAIAKDLKMSAPKVSRLKKSIAGKWKQYDRG